MAGQLARGRGRGTPYNPLVSDVMERVYGPTAGEDRPQLHPHAQPAVQTLVETVTFCVAVLCVDRGAPRP